QFAPRAVVFERLRLDPVGVAGPAHDPRRHRPRRHDRARGPHADAAWRDPAPVHRYRRERALLALRLDKLASDLPAHLLGAEAVPVKRSSEFADLMLPWAGLIIGVVSAGFAHQFGSEGVFDRCMSF